MEPFGDWLPNEDDRILYELGTATVNTDSRDPFEYDFVRGYPFVWIYHGGLCAGAMRISYAYLLHLARVGYVKTEHMSSERPGSFTLTRKGLARYTELNLVRKSSDLAP